MAETTSVRVENAQESLDQFKRTEAKYANMRTEMRSRDKWKAFLQLSERIRYHDGDHNRAFQDLNKQDQETAISMMRDLLDLNH